MCIDSFYTYISAFQFVWKERGRVANIESKKALDARLFSNFYCPCKQLGTQKIKCNQQKSTFYLLPIDNLITSKCP